MADTNPIINKEAVEQYLTYQREQERSKTTLQKYKHDLNALIEFLAGVELTKTALISWKERLIGEYAPTSVNGYVWFIINVKLS